MKKSWIVLGVIILGMSACKKDDPVVCEDTTAPSASCETGTYCFLRDGYNTVSYSGQTARLNQLEEMTSYMKTGNTPNTVVEEAVLLDMFSNGNGDGSVHFSDDAAVSGKQLQNKCFLGTVDTYLGWFAALEAASISTVEGSNGTAGVVTSTTNPTKAYLLDANGVEHIQLIEKGLMGDVLYYQAMATYIDGTENGSYDNVTIDDPDAGNYYTEAEHKFDEAFGYFGVPTDFPTNTDGVRFHGKYCNSRDAALGTNAIMDAFLSCREAITNNEDVSTHTDALRTQWHRAVAGTALSYLKDAKENIDDAALKCHELSEAYAFIGNLLHNRTDLALTPAQVQEAYDLLGTNFYETTEEDIDNTIEFLINNTLIDLVEFASI